MNNLEKKWQVKSKLKSEKGQKINVDKIVEILLANRGIKTNEDKKRFLSPIKPENLKLRDAEIDEKFVKKAIRRVEKAIKNNEQIIIYGDYDADGVCATAILWEALFKLTKNVSPYIPDRFSEGYGIKEEIVVKLKESNSDLKLIITVDNGIVANNAIKKAISLGIDIIITDHHQKGKELPKAFSIIHTDKVSGSGIAWFFSQAVTKSLAPKYFLQDTGLELAAIGTIADQLPLVGVNRSIAKYGLLALNRTRRLGLNELFKTAGIQVGEIGTYTINYLIAPRLNAMGRITHAIDSLRLLCTNNMKKAGELASLLEKTNKERQIVVEKVILNAFDQIQSKSFKGAIVISGDYHEGVIGLAAGKLVEKFYRPTIVISKGKILSKASARSISGFNIIDAIRKLDDIIEGGGGHPMAAGFSIKTERITEFMKRFSKISQPLLPDSVLQKKVKIDLEIGFEIIDEILLSGLKKFEPTGIGNPGPVFVSRDINVKDIRSVGADAKHLKINLEKDGIRFSSIAFGLGYKLTDDLRNKTIDILYGIEENVWNGTKTLQLNIKDLKLSPNNEIN